MAGISISGLVSGSFDWKSVVDQLITVDSAPVTRLQNEEAANNNKLASLADISTAMTDLQNSVISLRSSTLFKGRSAASSLSGSTWGLTASTSATLGSYTIGVSQLATSARRVGASGVSAKVSASSDVSSVTLATMPTATAIRAGSFTVDGKTITVATTDRLSDVFTQISTATSGKVQASYDSATDKITFASTDGSEVELGATNDTSNFLAAIGLANNASTSVTSSFKLGSASLSATLGSSRLAGALTPDGSGNGSFSINGVTINYNVNTDTLKSVLNKINASTAGVTATYDPTNDRFLLTNNATGDVGVGANEISGGLLTAMGLTTGSALQHGKNAEFTVNGGGTMVSASNTLDGALFGATGLSVKVDTATTQTVSVTADTASMKSAITDFIDKFNAVQTLIESETAIKVGADGKVTTATLASNHDVENWGTQLRRLAFQSIGGLSTTMSRLSDIGIDFDSTDAQLSVKDSGKLEAALANNSEDINAFFTNTSTGFAQQISNFLTQTLSSNGGGLATQKSTLTKQNTDIEAQIATLNARLASERERLTNAFIAMDKAKSTANQQQTTLNNMFKTSSSSSSS